MSQYAEKYKDPKRGLRWGKRMIDAQIRRLKSEDFGYRLPTDNFFMCKRMSCGIDTCPASKYYFLGSPICGTISSMEKYIHGGGPKHFWSSEFNAAQKIHPIYSEKKLKSSFLVLLAYKKIFDKALEEYDEANKG